MAPQDAEGFRTRIKAVELEAERLQQEAMYTLAQSGRIGQPAASAIEAANASIAAYQAVLRPFPRKPLERCLRHLQRSKALAMALTLAENRSTFRGHALRHSGD